MKRGKKRDKQRQSVLLTLPALSATVLVSMLPMWVTSDLLIPFLFFTESNHKPVRLHAPETVLSSFCLNWERMNARWRLVLAVELPMTCRAHHTSICCVLPGVTVTACVLGGGKLTYVRGWGLAKESNWYRRGHFTQRSFQEVSHQDAKESCISFIAGQTEQPGVEGPLEDNIP